MKGRKQVQTAQSPAGAKGTAKVDSKSKNNKQLIWCGFQCPIIFVCSYSSVCHHKQRRAATGYVEDLSTTVALALSPLTVFLDIIYRIS